MKIKHPQLAQIDGKLCFDLKSQLTSKDARDTSARYFIYEDDLIIAGYRIKKHPKFKNIGQFEGWINKWFYNHATDDCKDNVFDDGDIKL